MIFSLSVALYSFVKTKEEIKHDADHRLMMAAKAIQLVLPPHFIDRGTYDSYLERPLFLHINQRLKDVNDALQTSYIYSLVKLEEGYFFTSGSFAPKELQEIESVTYPRFYRDSPTKVLDLAFESMKPQYHEYQDQWGRFRSVFVPQTAANGQKFIMAANINLDKVEEALFWRLASQFIFIFLLFTSFVPLLLYVRVIYRTYRKRMETINQELEVMVEQRTKALMHANRLVEVGTLAAGAAHEIKNPLSVIQLYTETLLEREGEEKLSQDVEQMLKKIIHASGRIKDLSEGLRSFAKPSDIKSFSDVSLHKIINHILLIYEPIYKKKIRIMFCSDLAATNDIILGLTSQVEQVFSNLFSNARDAIEETGRNEGHIWISTKNLNGDYIELKVRDDGKGMDEDTYKRIFTPFMTTKSGDKGTGLGLSIIQSLILSMNGRIEVQSALNQGTTFTILFPLKKAIKEQ